MSEVGSAALILKSVQSTNVSVPAWFIRTLHDKVRGVLDTVENHCAR